MNTKIGSMVLIACLVSALSGGCLDDKVVELVVTGEKVADFAQNETSSSWTQVAVLDVGQEIRDILKDNGYDVSDVKLMELSSLHYGVTNFDQPHDWVISGEITVTYKSDTYRLINYTPDLGTPVSVEAALGKKILQYPDGNGVFLINTALKDFLAGQNPILTFTINNQTTTPAPSGVDPMIFNWREWLTIKAIVSQEVTVPDPF